MYKLNKLFITLIFILLSTLQPSFAGDNHIPVRVGISDTNFNTYLFDTIEFNNINSLNIMDAATGYQVHPKENSKTLKVTTENSLFRIYVDNILVARNLTGPIMISAIDNCFIEIKDLKRKGRKLDF